MPGGRQKQMVTYWQSKLVRGAYMEKERDRAWKWAIRRRSMNKDETDVDYNAGY